jgi:hypothetical protein
MDEPHLDEGECVMSDNDTLVVVGASYDSDQTPRSTTKL